MNTHQICVQKSIHHSTIRILHNVPISSVAKLAVVYATPRTLKLNNDNSYITTLIFKPIDLFLTCFLKNSQFCRDFCPNFDFYNVFNESLIGVKTPNLCEM